MHGYPTGTQYDTKALVLLNFRKTNNYYFTRLFTFLVSLFTFSLSTFVENLSPNYRIYKIAEHGGKNEKQDGRITYKHTNNTLNRLCLLSSTNLIHICKLVKNHVNSVNFGNAAMVAILGGHHFQRGPTDDHTTTFIANLVSRACDPLVEEREALG